MMIEQRTQKTPSGIEPIGKCEQDYQNVFCRQEIKYLLSEAQYRQIRAALEGRLQHDRYYFSTIQNLYYDTPDYRLIRRSLQKPKYKEKLRLRCYVQPNETAPAFVEIKKKVGGVVYKRREVLPYSQAFHCLHSGDIPADSQFFRELDWFLKFYETLQPRVFLSSVRHALCDAKSGLRVTFDRDILWRDTDLDLRAGVFGENLIPNQRLMEIKTTGALPVWVVHILSEAGARPTGFSKYGEAYCRLMQRSLSDTKRSEFNA